MHRWYTYHAGGAPPTDVTAEQTGVSTVLVMWTAPSPPPTDGYQVQITRGSTTTTVTAAGASHTFSVDNQYGVYSIQVRSLSPHFQSNEATPAPVEVTVRGKHDRVNGNSIIYIILLYPDGRRLTTVRSNDTLGNTLFQLISDFFHVKAEQASSRGVLEGGGEATGFLV